MLALLELLAHCSACAWQRLQGVGGSALAGESVAIWGHWQWRVRLGMSLRRAADKGNIWVTGQQLVAAGEDGWWWRISCLYLNADIFNGRFWLCHKKNWWLPPNLQ